LDKTMMKKTKWGVVLGVVAALLAAGVAFWQREMPKAKMMSCLSNLRMVDSAKLSLARLNNLTNGTPVTAADIAPWIAPPVERYTTCPGGGKLTLGAIGEEPHCSIHGGLLGSEK
jgi:type II secretory pathway pseudopilin PulG